MNFGFVGAALKAVGKGALKVAEVAGPAAATAFGGPLAGSLVNIAVQGIEAAQAKHGAVPAPVVVSTASGPVAIDPRKLDVMQYLESQAGTIASLVLASTGKPVADPARFATGVNALVEGLVDIMKAIEALPTTTPVAAPTSPVAAAVTVVTPAPFVGTVSNADAPAKQPDVIALLQQVLLQLAPKAAT